MPQIRYEGEGKTVAVEGSGTTTVLGASLAHGIPHAHACGGHAKCSTCRVLVIEGRDHLAPPGEDEKALAKRHHLGSEVRLACQAVVTGDVTLRRLVVDEDDLALVEDEVAGGGAAPSSAGEERRVAILFCDVRGFTTFAEAHLAYDVIHLLNRWFRCAGAAIESCGGCIDNYMGDGILALFSHPTTCVADAVRAGLRLVEEASRRMQPYTEAHFEATFRVGVGIHVGDVVLGAVGVGERRRLTAIGDAVNLAARIEGATKDAGVDLLVSQAAHDEVRERALVGARVALPLKGKTGTHSLYEIRALT